MNHNYSMLDRVAFYNGSYGKKYPASIIHTDGGWCSAYWMLGNNYRSKIKFYGSYPPEYLGRIMALFPDAKRIMHAFSGALPKSNYVRVDMNPENHPDRVASIENLPYMDDTFDLCVADPPYDRSDSERYGTPHPNKSKCLNELIRVAEPGGYIVWLDTRKPMYRKREVELACVIAIDRSTNHRIRGCWIFRKHPLEYKLLACEEDINCTT